ncbi:MAG: hypothetical protein Q7T74_02430, partial [Candidatus Saccharibacteria bacterium]|nr:hypothetical protein [Candidatus Saccharibacteria bacterium]
PLVEVQGSHNVDVIVSRLKGKLAINLVNTSGPHSNPRTTTFDEIPIVGPLTVSIRSPQKPKEVKLEPNGGSIPYKFSNGKIEVVLQKLDIHNIVVVE